MKYYSILCALMMLVCAGMCFASDIDGKWSGKMQGPNGESELVFTFKVQGDTLTGTVGSPMGDMPMSNGKVQGKTFSFDVSMGEMAISHQCTIDGDTITMKVNGFGPEPMDMLLKRVAQAK